MPHMTDAEWRASLEECGETLRDEDILKIIYSDGPNALFNDKIREMMVARDSFYNYFRDLYPTRVWNNFQPTTELGEIYHPAYLPFDMSLLRKSSEICSPELLNECDKDRCTIPKGGISHIPQMEFWSYGAKTEPICVANYRNAPIKVLDLARRLLEERFQVDEMFLNIFYTWATIRMLGHKWVLETTPDGGSMVPIPSVNPYNMLGGFRYSYLEPLFPQVGNINNITALDIPLLDMLGRALTNSRNSKYMAMGPRQTPIYEFWTGEDLYRQEILDNPEYVERMKYTMPTSMLPGYRLLPNNGGATIMEKEIIGNFNFRQVPSLPRFAESTQGGLTVVQPKLQVAVDVGFRSLHNYREWDNAPFTLNVILGKGMGEILTRPAITVGVEGREILPITGDPRADWRYRNEYDKECNRDRNKPWMEKDYEMGFRMLDPDAGMGFIARAKKFRLRPTAACDLRDIFAVTPPTNDCDLLTVGCNTVNALRGTNNITETTQERRVLCNAVVCGVNTMWKLKFTYENIDSVSPNQNPLGTCDCGDQVQLIVNDLDTGLFKRLVTGTLIEPIRPNAVNAGFTWYVTIGAPLAADECIAGAFCPDATPTVADISDEVEVSEGKLRFIVDSLLTCDVGDTVTITYKDEAGTTLDTVSGTITLVDPIKMAYEVTSAEPDWGPGFVDGTCTMTITCA